MKHLNLVLVLFTFILFVLKTYAFGAFSYASLLADCLKAEVEYMQLPANSNNEIFPSMSAVNVLDKTVTGSAPKTFAANVFAVPNTTVSVPVTVQDFTNIGAVSLTMYYDAAVLTFQGATVHPAFPSLWVFGNNPGVITAGGFSVNSGITLPFNATLFTIQFLYLGGYTDLSWFDNGSSCEYADWPNYNALVDVPQEDYYFNGSVSQEGVIILNCPEDIVVNNDSGQCGAMLDFSAIAFAFPKPDITFEIGGEPVVPPFFFLVGITTVEVSAQNEHGKATCSFEVEVIDAEAPAPPPAGSSTVDCIQLAAQPENPYVNDNCEGLIAGTLIDIDFIPDPIICGGFKVYTYSFTDQAENTSFWNFTYTILPLSGPVLVDLATDCSSLNQSEIPVGLQEASAFDATQLEPLVTLLYEDNCGGPVSAQLSSVVPDENNSDESWTFHYIFSLSDLCNNIIECSVTFTGGINDQVPENLLLENITIAEGEAPCYGASQTITATNVLVEAGGSLELIAGESVFLLPGFTVLQNGYLHASIGQEYCVNQRKLVSIQDSGDIGQIAQPANTNANRLIIFPNPGNGLFNVVINEELEEGSIEVYTLQGAVVYSIEPVNFKQTLDLMTQPAGVYVVRLTHNSGIDIQKIIKY